MKPGDTEHIGIAANFASQAEYFQLDENDVLTVPRGRRSFVETSR
jgi:hypothetical protein